MEGRMISKVKGFEGRCKPVWLNKNQIDWLGSGTITGFFRLTGKGWFKGEFHGAIYINQQTGEQTVLSTETN